MFERQPDVELVPTVQVHWRTRKKNGDWGKPQPAALAPADIPILVEEQDREIMSLLLGAADPQLLGLQYVNVGTRASFRITGPLIERVLPTIARSGRMFLRDADLRATDLTPLVWDDEPAWWFSLDVRVLPDERLAVDGALTRDDRRIAVTDPQVLLSPAFLILGDTVARLEHRGVLSWLIELRRSGRVVMPAKAAPALIEALARSHVDPQLLPDELRYEVISATPQPRIRLARSSRPQGHGTRDELDAAIEFDYAGTIVPALPQSTGYDAERRRVVRRQESREREAVQRLEEIGFHRPWYFNAKAGTLAIAVEKFPAAVRALVEDGWHVEAEGRVFRAARSVQLQVKSGVDWFELHGQVDFGDGRSVAIAELLAALRRGDGTVILDDGTRGMVPEEWLRRYGRIAAFGETEGDHVRFRSSQAALLDALLAAQPAVRIDDGVRARPGRAGAVQRHQPARPPPSRSAASCATTSARGSAGSRSCAGSGSAAASPTTWASARPSWCWRCSTAAARTREARAPRTSLVVVPRSLVFNWMDEAARFAPELRVLDYTGDARAAARVDGLRSASSPPTARCGATRRGSPTSSSTT